MFVKIGFIKVDLFADRINANPESQYKKCHEAEYTASDRLFR
jgi:hypothetical protein